MFAVWQKTWPAMGLSASALRQFGNCYRRPTVLRNTIEETVHVGSKDNRAFAIPCSATAKGGFRQDSRLSATIDINRLQLAVGKKSETGAVWRPKRHGCTFGSGQLLFGASGQRT